MSYRLYDITPKGDEYTSYSVKINGREVKLDHARVSAVPFNRRWPGHQRQIEQTEQVNFLQLATDEPLLIEITPKAPFERVIIRPLSLGIEPEVQGNTIRFTLPGPCYVTVEPYGRHNALHIFADEMPDYSMVDLKAPQVIYFGKGEHDIGEVELLSGQTVFLDEGAVVYGRFFAKDQSNIRIQTIWTAHLTYTRTTTHYL